MKRSLEERKAELEAKVATAAGALNAAEELKALRWACGACVGRHTKLGLRLCLTALAPGPKVGPLIRAPSALGGVP